MVRSRSTSRASWVVVCAVLCHASTSDVANEVIDGMACRGKEAAAGENAEMAAECPNRENATWKDVTTEDGADNDDADNDGADNGEEEDNEQKSDAKSAADTAEQIGGGPECGLYLAESTIPNSGLGVFSGVNVARGQRVGYGDAVVTVTDLAWHNFESERLHFLWFDYEWNAQDIGTKNGEAVDALVPGFGAAVNAHPGLVNVATGLAQHDALGLHRSVDVGAGASTAYCNWGVSSISPIPAGAEVFLDYGDNAYDEQPHVFGDIPRRRDYAAVDRLWRRFNDWVRRHVPLENHAREPLLNDLWDLIASMPFRSRATTLLPSTWQEAQQVMATGTLTDSLFPETVRSMEWLREHARCMDNIRPAPSTIRQAGRGAFATRDIPKGALVAPSPLIHIPDRSILKMYGHLLNDDGQEIPNPRKKMPPQLLLNYCFGHNASSLLLCPYGHLVWYINHSRENANAKIVWADNFPWHQSHWMNQTVDWLAQEPHAGLAVDYVATRDISVGEEVFLDYGDAWVTAWTDWEEYYYRPSNPQHRIPASHWNHDLVSPVATHSERREARWETDQDVYPPNVQVRCFFSELGLDRNTDETESYDWHDLDADMWQYPCRIVSRSRVEDSTEFVYQAVVGWHLDYDDEEYEEDDEVDGYHVQNIPRQGLLFVDKPYTDDQFFKRAFRHEMMIPNDMFPAAWRNLE